MSEKNLSRLLEHWRREPLVTDNIILWQTTPASPGDFCHIPYDLHPGLRAALVRRGIDQLYSHQADSLDTIHQGKHVVVVTGTASGKTLCYMLPVLQTALTDPQATALFLYPTKALTQDQAGVMSAMLQESGANPASAAIYDGDTPVGQRAAIRQQARLLLTNPDMLHISMLPHHTLWAEFFHNLRYVVIDEMHIYRGVFGSHVANLIRRLRRVANFYGAAPQFILTSATIANPRDLAEMLIEQPVQVIDSDGSPHGERHLILYNPPVTEPDLGVRRSAAAEAAWLIGDLLGYNVQTLSFTRSRRSVELLLRDLRERYPDVAGDLHGYRSGYLPHERRSIERSLRDGRARAVVATNALELGIDVGSMEAVLLVGYPGTVAATRQRLGRAGRRQSASLGVVVASASPLDQFLMLHPEFLLERNPEQALINPNNLLILLQHLRCAAFELPFHHGEGFGGAPMDLIAGLLELLDQSGELHLAEERFFWTSDQYPANHISLRSASDQPVVLQAMVNDRWMTVGEVDEDSALWMVHPDAIYLHEGDSYRVQQLDLEAHQARLEPAAVDYYTVPKSQLALELIETVNQKTEPGCEVNYGEIQVTSQVIGYKKIRWYTQENLGENPLELPPSQLRTTAYWLALTPATVEQLQTMGAWRNDPNDYGPGWPRQRKLARERDHFTCQICGQVEAGKAHHVHHKTPFRNFASTEAANQLDNLITLCPACHRRAETVVRIRSGLAGLAYTMHNLAPLFLMCDPGDLGVAADPQSALAGGQPAVVLYDQVPAGIGLSEEIFRIHPELVARGMELVARCPCHDGCPSCVGPAGESGSGGKMETLAIFQLLNGYSLTLPESGTDG